MRILFVLSVLFFVTYALVKLEHLFQDLLPVELVRGSASLVVPKAYGLVILMNVFGSAFVLIFLATKVTRARKEFDVKYPIMYASGQDEKSHMFNCVQRGHQQALETYPIFLVASLISGMRFPLVVSCMGLMWAYARLSWAKGYRTGVPEKRYQDKISFFIWFGFIIPLLLSAFMGIDLLMTPA